MFMQWTRRLRYRFAWPSFQVQTRCRIANPLTQPQLHLLQDTAVPFALENLGCAGTETRLLDCPVVGRNADDSQGGLNVRDYDYSNPSDCDPFSGTFAEIACGTSGAAGVLHVVQTDNCQAGLHSYS